MPLYRIAADRPPSTRASTSRDSKSQAPRLARDPALDGLRGLAVLMVFVFHYGGGLQSPSLPIRILGVITEAGWTGVVLFFALSGFLITGSLWDSLTDNGTPARISIRTCLGNFYARRALRILPLYYSVLLVTAVLTIAHGSVLPDLAFIPTFAFFLQDLPFFANSAINSPSPLPLYHLWSLAVEEQFYLLWPAFLLIILHTPTQTRRRAIRLSLQIFAVSVVFCVVFYGLPVFTPLRQAQVFDSFLVTHAGALALGASVALGLRTSRVGRISASSRWVHRRAPSFFFLGLAGFLLASYFAGSFYLYSPIQYILGLASISIAAAAIIPIVILPGYPRFILSLRPLGWLGRISYGFYIFHILLQPAFDFLAAHLVHSSSRSTYQLVRMLVAFPLSVLAAWLSFHFLEAHFLHKQSRFPMKPPLPQI